MDPGCLINSKWLFKVVEKMLVDGWPIVVSVYLMLVISWWAIEDIMPNAFLMLLIQWLMAMNGGHPSGGNLMVLSWLYD